MDTGRHLWGWYRQRDTVPCWTHGTVKVRTPDGERQVVSVSQIDPEDINDDGTVSL